MSAPAPIRRLLIANRGEIARRITRSARAAGMAVVAVFAPSDANAPHVRDADVAVGLRGEGASGTYLDMDQIVAAARASGADAVHPGYGFLSERADFATAVIEAGLTWVGPPPAAISAMGDKLSAKRLMVDAGVPVLPTLELDATADSERLPPQRLVGGMVLPLIVKASAGGGGKGMRIVTDLADLGDAVAAARREAAASFGDPTVFVEPYIAGARHVEIQILADDHGHAVHCFERDCSIQRRHQKIIEEAPSPALDADLRARMGAAAVAAALAVGYRSAGTVEFVLDARGGFWFLEVNTRLQVEHPVTEAVTGLDLVREQLRIAAGQPLSVRQDDLRITGHAVEARLYAEDPAAGWLPATGTLADWSPATEPRVRWDSGVETGSVVGVEWDPMLAKVIAHAPTREEAALRLASALERSRIRGVVTNRDFLVGALRHPTFLAGEATTDFTTRPDVALARTVTDEEVTVAAIAATLTAQARRRAGAGVLATLPSRWRTGVLPDQTTSFTVADGSSETSTVTVRYRRRRDGVWTVGVCLGSGGGGSAHSGSARSDTAPSDTAPSDTAPSETVHPETVHLAQFHAAPFDTAPSRPALPRPALSRPDIPGAGGARHDGPQRDSVRVEVDVDGVRTSAHVLGDGGTWWVQTHRGDLKLHEQPRFPAAEVVGIAGGLVAPMPGRVIEVATTSGARVGPGDLLVIVEAMKMEHRVTAPCAGVVADVRVAAGDQVSSGDLLVVVEPAATLDDGAVAPEDREVS